MTTPAEPVPAAMAAAWRASEAQLYGSLVWDPDLYQRVVTLVGQVVDCLRRLGASSEELRRAGQSPGELVRQVAAEHQTAPPSVDPVLIGQAALSMRLREVVGEQARVRRLERIAEASDRHDLWVVVEESGEPHGDLLDPYWRLEIEVATGRALSITAVADDSFTGVLHEVATVQVDLADGRLRDVAADFGQASDTPSRHQDWQARERHADQLRGGPAPR
jgi:hypothetical protein